MTVQGEVHSASPKRSAIHAGKNPYRVRESLAELESRLDPALFARINRSALVRLDQVRRWKTGGSESEATVVLRDGTELPVSRRRLAQVKALLRPPERT